MITPETQSLIGSLLPLLPSVQILFDFLLWHQFLSDLRLFCCPPFKLSRLPECEAQPR
jgi:hypothetical protein